MPAAAIAFLLGTLCLLSLPQLPAADAHAPWLLLVAAALALTCRWTRAPGFALLGFLHAAQGAATVLDARLPHALEGQAMDVVGVVVSLPVRDTHRLRFRLRLESASDENGGSVAWGEGALLRLAWYDRRGLQPPALVGGERLSLRVRLKRPRGLANPAGFDFERWLFGERIVATGYVVALRSPPLPSAGDTLLRARAALAGRLRAASAGVPRTEMLAALTLGERGGIGDHEWQLLRATGTGHLVAISGLHVGMLALLAYVIARHLWALWPALLRRLPAGRAAAVAAVAAAAGYAALAGFTLPTQRALVMVAVLMLAIFSRRNVMPGGALACALLLVLLLDPLAALAAGFWLSFAATAVLLYAGNGRRSATGNRWSRLLSMQMAVTLGLAPVALAVFGFQPLLAPLANLVAIPWTAWLVVPLALLGAALAALGTDLATVPLMLAGHAADWLFAVMALLVDVGGDWRLWREPSLVAALAAMVGVVLLLLPRGAVLRWFGVLWLLPLLSTAPPPRAAGELRVAVLDVGQGLAVLVTTANHALVYDAGPRYGSGFDSGRAVILPYLRRLGLERVDMLLLSHANADHTGGAAALLSDLPVGRVLHNAPLAGAEPEPCLRGRSWRWDGIDFDILHPPPARGPVSVQNDGSCVLRVRAPGGSVLLPGDLEASGEASLLAMQDDLETTLLVAAHHGSRTSSTASFVAATRPRLAVFSAGYRNRYGFPAAEVLARFQRVGSSLLETGRDGAVVVQIAANGGSPLVTRVRDQRRALWRER